MRTTCLGDPILVHGGKEPSFPVRQLGLQATLIALQRPVQEAWQLRQDGCFVSDESDAGVLGGFDKRIVHRLRKSHNGYVGGGSVLSHRSNRGQGIDALAGEVYDDHDGFFALSRFP